MIQFFIFRHGETDWNAEGRLQGQADIPLNTRGREQARSLGPALHALDLEWILSSDLNRALETARIAIGSKIRIATSADLREAHFGEAEGLLNSDVRVKYGSEHIERWISGRSVDLDVRFPFGESQREIQDRVFRALAQASQGAARVGIATHGGVVRRLVQSSQNPPSDPVRLPNCGLYRFEYEPAASALHYRGLIFGGD